MSDARDQMDFELGFEEANGRNIKAVGEYAKQTRAMLRELQEDMVRLNNNMQALNDLLVTMQQQQGVLLSRMVNGGPTSGT